jgi:photosystem II stability/assembly factor-like uncharacterized protein
MLTVRNTVFIFITISAFIIFTVLSLQPEKEILKQKKKSGSERRQEFMESFYYPRTTAEIEKERNDYLAANGSFKNLGEKNQNDNLLPWSSIGPMGIGIINSPSPGYTFYSGRIISFAMHGDNTNILYCGGASGGLWKSTNGGNSWFILLDTLSCPSVSSIAVSFLAADNIVWFSTGAKFNGAGTQIGRVYKSTNGGSTWSAVTGIPSVTTWVSKIDINTFRNNFVTIGTDLGLYKSTNGGAAFSKVSNSPISDILSFTNFIAPDTLNMLIGILGGGIHRSTNGGLTFSQVPLPDFIQSSSTRIVLANDKATSKTAALISKNNNKFLGVWTSSNKGLTWNHRSLPTADSGGQSFYNSALGVAPNGRITAGYNNREIFYSTNDAVSWSLGNWVHEDIQRIHVYNNALMFHVSDAGVYKSTNQGVDWKDAGGNWLTLSQSYTLTADNIDPNMLWSGLQDDGIIGGYEGSLEWTNLTCCDGGDYFRNGLYQYVNIIGLDVSAGHRYQRKLITAPLTGPWEAFSTGIPPGHPWSAAGTNDFLPFSGSFYTSMKQFVFKTNGAVLPWSQIGSRPHPTNDIWVGRILPVNGFVLAGFDISTNPPLRIYNNANGLWETPNLSVVPPGVRVTDFDRGSSPAVVYMTVSGTHNARIFKSSNSGASWVNITGNLPGIVNTRCILVNKSNNNIIYIGSDFGVFATTNGGVNWLNFSTGLPSVCYVNDMEFSAGNNFINAATYGRGVWRSGIITGVNNNTEIPAGFYLGQNFPNPFNPSTTIEYSTPVTAEVTIMLYDNTGREIDVLLKEKKSPGNYSLDFNGTELASGVYFYKIIATGNTEEFVDVRKMIILK